MALNILVVDDSSVMRSIIIKTLKLSGVPLGEIYQAGNGVEGLKMLNENWVDIALVDINMPQMNGEQMIDKIRENPELEDLKIIVVSTESSETRIENLIEKGANFIHKPFTPESLGQTIINAIGGIDEQQTGTGTFQSCDFDF